MVIIREPQFSQGHGGPDVLNLVAEDETLPVLVSLHRTLVSETARINRKSAAEMLALTLINSIPDALRLSRAAAI
jgi:hypothetical protein